MQGALVIGEVSFETVILSLHVPLAVLVAEFTLRLLLLVFVVLYNRKSLQINCVVKQKNQGLVVFELELNGSGVGLVSFHKMSPRTHHNYS